MPQFAKGTKLQRQFKQGTFTCGSANNSDVIPGNLSALGIGNMVHLDRIDPVGTFMRARVLQLFGTAGSTGAKVDRFFSTTVGAPVVNGTHDYYDYEDIANVTSIVGPSATTDQIDITSHNDEALFRESLPGSGLLDNGELQINCNYDPALDDSVKFNDFNAIVAGLTDGTDVVDDRAYPWRIKFPPNFADFVEFEAALISVEFGAPTDGALTLNLTLKVRGEITWVV